MPPWTEEASGAASVRVAGRRWDAARSLLLAVEPGRSLTDILAQAVTLMRGEGASATRVARIMRHVDCFVDGELVPREDWPRVFPPAGSRIEFFVRPRGGGGGGKNPLGVIFQVVVLAVSLWAGPAVAGAMNLVTASGALTAAGMAVSGLVGAGIMLLGGVVANRLFPVAQPKLSQGDAGRNSPAYAISGARNAANPYGVVPLILGRHRHTPPLGAKSWTSYSGDSMSWNMLLVWGHPDMQVTDFRIGDTPLEQFRGVTHVFHQSTTGDDLQLFGKSYNEQSVGAVLSAGVPVTRSLGECDEIGFDISANAMATVDAHSGTTGPRQVDLQVLYRREGGEWLPISDYAFPIRGRDFRFLARYIRRTIWAGPDGVLTTWRPPPGAVEIYPNRNPYVSGCAITTTSEIDEDGDWIEVMHVSDGVYRQYGIMSIGGAQMTPLVRSRAFAVPHGRYELRWTRLTPDANSQYIYDEISISAARAILNRPAFHTPVPVCVSELRIQATDQLSGYVDNFSAVCTSVVPCWNEATGKWERAATSNPAALMRYLLTSRHALYAPYGRDKLDDASLREFYRLCAERKYAFNFVADAEEAVWQRLTQVASAGRGGVTTDRDGMYAVTMDVPGKTPVQLLTPRNSWGMSLERQFGRMPHALRVKFVNADRDWQQDEGFVYADGYDASNATDIVEWDFPGKTSWEEVYRHARYNLAMRRLRPYSVSLSMDWERRVATRGDLVGVASDVLMNTFGTARVQRLIYEIDGETLMAGREEDIPWVDEGGAPKPAIPVGVELDDTVVFSAPAPARYGMAIRNAAGRPLCYEIVPRYGQQSAALLFAHPLTRAQIPPLRGLASVSILGDEYAEFLVADITPGDAMSADITLIPYKAEEILAAESGPIPPWTPPLHLDSIGSSAAIPPPVVRAIRSDESVLIKSGTASIPRLAVWWTLPAGSPENATLRLRVSLPDASGEEFTASGLPSEEFLAVQGVREGQVYAVRLRAVDRLGRASDWSAALLHRVVGRTTPPPAPSGVFLNGYTLSIEQRDRPLDVVGHKIFMAMDENDDIAMALELTHPYTATGTFNLRPWAGRARAVFVRTVDELGLLSEPVRVAVNLGDVLPDNVLFEFSERDREWSGDISGGYAAGGALWSEERAALYPQDDADPLHPQEDRLPYSPSGGAMTLSYQWAVDIPDAYAGARVLALPDAVSGRLQSLEFRHYAEPALYPQADGDALYAQDDAAALYPRPEVSAWEAMPDDYRTPGGETLEFRVTYGTAEVAQLVDIRTNLDVEDKELALQDVTVEASGATRLPVPPRYFRGITHVVFNLQYVEGSRALSVQRVPGSEIRGADGFVSEGPVARAFTAQLALTSASCDIIIRGY